MNYPHMCRDEHQEIGHSDSSEERCPLCRALDSNALLVEALEAIIRRVALVSPHYEQARAALAAAKEAA